MKQFRLTALGLCLWGALSLVTSCGGSSESTGTDSNTHWLKDCDADSDCGALSCVCGVCTKSCDDGSDCQPFGGDAACEVPTDCGSANGPTACVREPSGNGGSSAGGAASGSGGSAGASADPECPAMDARSGSLNCGTVLGFAFDGRICGAVFCSCEGSECGELFSTGDECDSAYKACYAKRGVARDCTTHADCRLQPRTCCAGCGTPDADLLVATSATGATLVDADMCIGDPNAGCPECEQGYNPALYSFCLGGECRMADVSAHADCETNDDCKLLSKDCCQCPDDVRTDLIAVSQDTRNLPFCAVLSCEACRHEPDQQVGTTCNTELGKCEMIVTTL